MQARTQPIGTDTSIRALFTSLTQEFDQPLRDVEGVIPVWASATLLRNGPAIFEQGHDRFSHWFDGYSVLHRLSIRDGAVHYRNRTLGSVDYLHDSREGRIVGAQFGTPSEPGSWLRRVQGRWTPRVTNTCVNLMQVGDLNVAISDLSLCMRFDPETLETLGEAEFDDQFGAEFLASSAHPAWDPATGEWFNVVMPFKPKSKAQVFRQTPANPLKRQVLATLPTRGPFYFHSVACTPKWIVFVEHPLAISPFKALTAKFTGRSFHGCFNWSPQQATRIHLIERATGRTRLAECPAFFYFHVINSFDEGNQVVLDLSSYRDPKVIDDLYFDQIERNGLLRDMEVSSMRLRIDPARQTAHQEVLTPMGFEFPHVSNQDWMRPYDVAWGATFARRDTPAGCEAMLMRSDISSQSLLTWSEPGCFPGEGLTLAGPNRELLLLSLVADTKRRRSYLLFLDAHTLEERARVWLPCAVPPGLHGSLTPTRA